MAPTPWTRRFAFSWPQSVAYFERRYGVLRRFEDEGLVRQFRVSEQRIGVYLGDANHELVYGLRSIEGSLFKPDGDWDRMSAALDIVLADLQPKRLLRPVLRFQWLIALDAEYDEARRAGALEMLGDAGKGLTDWSGLVDGELESPPSTFQAEFGILDAAEAPQRLSRQIGRVQGERDTPPPTLWPTESLPPVAFFCETIAQGTEPPEPSVEAISAFVRDSQDALGGIVSGMMERVTGMTRGGPDSE